jgi:hypothetical protein
MPSYGTIYGDDCLELGTPACEPCATKEKGRIRGVAFLKEGVEFTDPTDDAEWDTKITAGDVKLIPKTSGQFDGGTEKYSEGFGDDEKEYETSEFKGKFRDPNYAANASFYNQLRKVGHKSWKICYISENLLHISTSNVTCQPKSPIKDDKTTNVVWEVDFSFTQEDHPVPVQKPEGVFICD